MIRPFCCFTYGSSVSSNAILYISNLILSPLPYVILSSFYVILRRHSRRRILKYKEGFFDSLMLAQNDIAEENLRLAALAQNDIVENV